jgi:hypothetical protein
MFSAAVYVAAGLAFFLGVSIGAAIAALPLLGSSHDEVDKGGAPEDRPKEQSRSTTEEGQIASWSTRDIEKKLEGYNVSSGKPPDVMGSDNVDLKELIARSLQASDSPYPGAHIVVANVGPKAQYVGTHREGPIRITNTEELETSFLEAKRQAEQLSR